MIDWHGPSRQACPQCDRGTRDRACGVTMQHDGSGVAHCFRCGYVETLKGDAVRQVPGTTSPRAAAPIRHEGLSDFGRELWARCQPLAGDALVYLQARCCVVPPTDGHLRYHPALRHGPSGTTGPALVALVTDAVTCEPLTLHRTWVRADGSKAPVDPPRMLLGGHRKAGGVIRLWPDEAVTTGLAVAEGIETALSLAHAMAPVWACIDAGNLAALPVLSGIECLLIAADNDEAGIAAAESCGMRWAVAGREAHIVQAAARGADINDMARAA